MIEPADYDNRQIYGKYYIIESNGTITDISSDSLYANRVNIVENDFNILIKINNNYYPLANSYGYVNTYSDSIDIESQVAINYYNTNGPMPGSYYNFFIHFIDEYGNITKGFNINSTNFKIITPLNKIIEHIYLNDGRELFKYKDIYDVNGYYNTIININKIPEGFIGWFISHERFEKNIIYKGVAKRTDTLTLEFYSDELNFGDVINFDFDKLTTDGTKYYNILSKKLYVADSYENVLNSTKIKLTLDEELNLEDYTKVHLINSNVNNLYKKQIKNLIPCSDIFYNVNIDNKLDIKTSFISKGHALIANNVFYNSALKIYQTIQNVSPISEPYTQKSFVDYFAIPFESLQLNNKPVITFFPDKGLNTTDEKEKTFVVGNIIEVKNTIDLYQQKQINNDELYPKSLDWYNPDIYFTDIFNKTIRRSNVIQDESLNIGWRQFEIEQYKNITENKGDIIKLIPIGLYFLVHTEHSLFLFNSTDTLKSSNGNIQLDNTDIWDINYKEVLTSNLGYGGIQKESHGIYGSFGYIFYDKSSNEFYRYDNNNLERIDYSINDILLKLSDKDVHFVDDKKRNRLLISFVEPKGNDFVISYNYQYNTFVSRHTYCFDKGFSTKNNLYLITKKIYTNDDGEDVTHIVNFLKFTDNSYAIYHMDNVEEKINIIPYKVENDSSISVIINTSYELIKFIEYIKYKINAKVKKTISQEDYLPLEKQPLYSGDIIRFISEFCDTGDIDISGVDNITGNKIEDYKKPYWRLGNWHINMIRNNMDKYNEGSITSDESSRLYGNWFVIKFVFKGGLSQKEIETLDCNFSLDKN